MPGKRAQQSQRSVPSSSHEDSCRGGSHGLKGKGQIASKVQQKSKGKFFLDFRYT